MIRLATPEQIRCIEKEMISLGVSEELMMEVAGSACARDILTSFYFELKKGSVLVLCGPGNNGADGFVCARHLSQMYPGEVKIAFVSGSFSNDLWRKQKERLESFGLDLLAIRSLKDLPLQRPALIVDALFGTGLNRPLEGLYKELVRWTLSQSAPVVSIDAPSGLDLKTGQVLGAAIQADLTLGIEMPKPGFYLEQGPEHVGRLKILPLGFAKHLKKKHANSTQLLSRRKVRSWLPKKPRTAHKGVGGRCLVLAGREEQPGCALLAAEAASRVGVGYVTLMSESLSLQALREQSHLLFAPTSAFSESFLEKMDSVVFGPGLGVNAVTERLLQTLKNSSCRNVVVDADGLNTACEKSLFPFPAHWIVTPHPLEMARILGCDVERILKDRLKSLEEVSGVTGCLVLSKGYHPLFKYGPQTTVVPTGNRSLAKAGSGDVLSGMIGGFLSQKLSPEAALGAAVYVHGLAADHWVRRGFDYLSMTPQDLLSLLPEILRELR